MIRQYKKPFIPLIKFFGKKKIENKFSNSPILIGGCARSGTTLLQSIISAHPSIFVFPYEIWAFNHWEKDEAGKMIPSRIDRLYRESLRYKVPKTAKRWCSKAPSNVRNIGNILNYFNNQVKFIHLIRDARDVLLSYHPGSKDRYWVSPERWVNDVTHGLAYKDHPNVLTLHYEDLIRYPGETINKLCDFLEEPVCEEIYNWRKYTKIKKSNAIFGQIGPLDDSSIGKWKKEANNERVKTIMDNKDIKDTLHKCGYL